MKMHGDVGFGPRVLPNFLTQSLLEQSAAEGESPVAEGKKDDTGYPEYRSSDMEWKDGGQ